LEKDLKEYYKDVIMRQRHIASAMFRIEDMTEIDSCELQNLKNQS
jgi:hypothetical protein